MRGFSRKAFRWLPATTEMTSSRIYVYKLVADNGGAPCVHRGILSLAICKPKIRAAADKNDFIVGFGGQRLDHRPIYAAKITAKPSVGKYYVADEYAGRPDRIYRNVDGAAILTDRAKFHTTGAQLRKDVGLRFEHANVLLSDDFIYFGSKGRKDYEALYPALTSMLGRLRQGHRVNHHAAVQSDLEALIAELWALPKRGALGGPSDQDRTLRCNEDRD